MTFNISHMEDINERILLETTGNGGVNFPCNFLLGVQIMPLIMNPGKILITNSIVYFQPMNNVASNPVDKYKLDSITRVAKRRHLLRHVGLEIFMQNDQSIFFSFKT